MQDPWPVGVEDPAVHLPVAVGGDAVGTRALGDELIGVSVAQWDALHGTGFRPS